MKLYNYKNIEEHQGNLMLIYGPSGVGKTSTALQTSTDPIALITSEDRKLQTTIKAINRPDLVLKVGIYENFNDLLDTLEPYRFKGAKTILKDSLTHLMMIHLTQEILGENFTKMESDAKKNAELEISKQLTMQTKLSVESYGALAGQMNRLMSKLQGLTKPWYEKVEGQTEPIMHPGYDVICTARMTERPKWNRALQGAPALMGQEFSKSMDGFFDFIGMMEQNELDENGRRIYPPLISFEAPDGEYLAKWTGIMPPKGVIRRPCRIEGILKVANGIA